jgi:predicted Holliday junction resolvase-like endonuclease
MQSKLQDLQKKLQAEEAEKREFVHKYEEILNRCDQLQDQVNSNQEQQHEGKVCDNFISYFMKILNFYDDQPLQFLH